MQRGLATLYESDAGFAANIDRYGAGLTAFLMAAIRAHTGRAGTPNIESAARLYRALA